jgi:hypothetical protein
VIVGVGVTLAAVLALRVLPWSIRRGLAAAAALRDRAALLAHAREQLAQAPLLRDSAVAITQALVSLAPNLLSGASAVEAGADLAGQLNLVAARHRAKLTQLDVLPDSVRAGRLARARVHVVFETDIRGLAGLMHAIAAGDAALAVQELRIVAPDPTSPRRLPEILKVEMTTAGWYLRNGDQEKRDR